ncbi:MAG TPA: 5-oxoprolinase subunit PxpB [Stellaceae bacterium]|nr:5-oxoprolinase subunit PxpB [Stellaceae bacterium]
MAVYGAPRFLNAGEAALVVEIGDSIAAEISERVAMLESALGAAAIAGVGETVPTYRSLLVNYDPAVIDTEGLIVRLRALWPPTGSLAAPRHWIVPVAYGGSFGEDLDEFARRKAMMPEAVVERHLAGHYRVYMVGFMPGFTYLGGLDPELALTRRDVPRTLTPAGSISIGGIQTAISSIAAPSGWHLLGRTPVRAFDKRRDPPFLFNTGDLISFERIDAATWRELAEAAAAGEPVARPVPPS